MMEAPSPSSPALHPVVLAAARGELPPWATAGRRRREHMARVADLLGTWAVERGEAGGDRTRWIAAGHLHDALRDGNDEVLRPLVDLPFRDLPAKVLHGPAVARRLRVEGVEDGELLHAVAYHTLGSAEFGVLGMALYAADFLEPGRSLQEEWRAGLRERAAGDLEGVVKEILAARIRHLVARGRPIRQETSEFWNRMADGEAWASASEV